MKNSLGKILSATLLALGASPGLALGASLGVNFNNGDLAGAQVDGNLGALWTNVNTNTGTGLALNAPGSSVTMDWSSSNFWSAGSWHDGTSSLGLPIAMMRVYLDDGGSGVSVTLHGLSSWLSANSAASYNLRLFFSTDSDNATFQNFSVSDGAMTLIETGTSVARGNGTWDGTSLVATGDNSGGTRGDSTFLTNFTQDTITIAGLPRSGSVRGTLAGFTLTTTAVPEPSTYGLLGAGALGAASAIRRRRKLQTR